MGSGAGVGGTGFGAAVGAGTGVAVGIGTAVGKGVAVGIGTAVGTGVADGTAVGGSGANTAVGIGVASGPWVPIAANSVVATADCGSTASRNPSDPAQAVVAITTTSNSAARRRARFEVLGGTNTLINGSSRCRSSSGIPRLFNPVESSALAAVLLSDLAAAFLPDPAAWIGAVFGAHLGEGRHLGLKDGEIGSRAPVLLSKVGVVE